MSSEELKPEKRAESSSPCLPAAVLPEGQTVAAWQHPICPGVRMLHRCCAGHFLLKKSLFFCFCRDDVWRLTSCCSCCADSGSDLLHDDVLSHPSCWEEPGLTVVSWEDTKLQHPRIQHEWIQDWVWTKAAEMKLTRCHFVQSKTTVSWIIRESAGLLCRRIQSQLRCHSFIIWVIKEHQYRSSGMKGRTVCTH